MSGSVLGVLGVLLVNPGDFDFENGIRNKGGFSRVSAVMIGKNDVCSML